MTDETPAKKRGPKPTLTKEGRKAQYRASKKVSREREAAAGKLRINAPVLAETKAKVEAYREAHGLNSLGEALDLMLINYVDHST